MTYSTLLKNIWNSIYTQNTNTSNSIKQFFHPNYEQRINGIVLDREQYIQHVIEQKNNITINSIDYKKILEKENELFAIYYAKGNNKNNAPFEAEIILYARFEDQKIIKMHGQVRLITGSYSDMDMKIN
jgi:hypothetical protein